MTIEVLDLKQKPYKVQLITSKKNIVLSSNISFEINKTLIVLLISSKYVILFSFILGKIFKISYEDYYKYIVNFTPNLIIPDILLDLDIIQPHKDLPRVPQPKYYFRNLHFVITPDCNLRCLYCYARSGRRGEHTTMTFDIAKSAIDFVSQYCDKQVYLKFIGEGETTTQFDLLKKIFNYAKKKIPNVEINPISTNGVFSQEVADWLIKNAQQIQISCDGPAFIQDKYRPLANGEGSSRYVEKTIKYFIKKKKPFRIRVTMVDDLIGNELKVINYFWQLGVNNLNFGPLEIIGAAKDSHLGDNDQDKIRASKNLILLFKEYQKLFELQEELGIDTRVLNFSALGSTITCGIYTKQNFIIDPYGNVSVCDRHTSPHDFKDHPFLKDFVIGFYDKKQKKIKINFKKLDHLINLIDNQLKVNNCLHCPVLAACSTICLYSLGLQYKTLNPKFSTCEELEHLGPYLTFDYFSKKYLIKKCPYLGIKSNRLFLFLNFNNFELDVTQNAIKLQKNPYIIITDIEKLKLIEQKILTYKNQHEELILFLLSFQLPKKQLLSKNGIKIKHFLSQLKQKRVYFKLTHPLPLELFANDSQYKKICFDFNLPLLITDSIDFYLVKNDTVYFSNNLKGTKKFSQYQDRQEIIEDYNYLISKNK